LHWTGVSSPALAAISLSAVSDSNNEDYQFVVEHFVDDPVVADAYAAKAPQGALQRIARMRLIAEMIDGINNALAILASNLRQVSGGAALDLD
jgi:hypothetical protein